MNVKVRFAPSPTGRLHVGNVRIAVMNYIFACQNDGEFLLRIDDTDKLRSTVEFENGIYDDLKWLGLPHQLAARQSNNIPQYNQAFEYLKEKGLVYPCFETPDELALARKIQLSNGIPPVYKKKNLSEKEIEAHLQNGEKPYWRFMVDHNSIAEWNDLVHSRLAIQLSALSDPVIVKPDGGFVYTFASVVDDINMGISHIIRGDDHVTNTAIQIQIFKALSVNIPEFAHLPLISSQSGEDISKRSGSSFSIKSLRENGAEPFAVVASLASLGSTYTYNPMDNMGDIIKRVNFQKISLSAPKFSLDSIYNLTQKVLSGLAYETVRARLTDTLNVEENLEDFWRVFRQNISKFDDVIEWYNICKKDCVDYVIEDKDFAKVLYKSLQSCSDGDWNTWVSLVKEKTTRRGADLFHEIRLVLTGREKGPELKDLFRLINRELILLRLSHSVKV